MEDRAVKFFAFTRPTSSGYERLLNREALDLVKALRAAGHKVVIEPNDGSPINYFTRKGDISHLQDPLFVQLVGVPLAIFTSVLSSWFYDMLKARKQKRADKGEPEMPQVTKVAVEVREDDILLFYDHRGNRISSQEAQGVVSQIRAQAESRSALAERRSPYPRMPYPICLEHSERVVGWADIESHPKGLLAKPAVIEDDETWERIQKGELRGFSIGIIVTSSQCSICGDDYAECNHIASLDYDGVICGNTIKRFLLTEISVVKDPVNQDCLLELKKVQSHIRTGSPNQAAPVDGRQSVGTKSFMSVREHAICAGL